MGLPVIISNFGHPKRITELDKTGIAVEPNNVGNISKELKKPATNQNLYRTLMENCKKAAPKYKWLIMEKKLISIHTELIGQ